MATAKTMPTDQNVEEFLLAVAPERKRLDAQSLNKMIGEITGLKPVMWGPSLIGFGTYHYKYDSGHEGDSFLAGFSPRKQNLVVYIMPGFTAYAPLLAKLGKHKHAKSCLYINKLEDIDSDVLRELIGAAFHHMKDKYDV